MKSALLRPGSAGEFSGQPADRIRHGIATIPRVAPNARPVLLTLGEPGDFDITPWAHRVVAIDAKDAGDWELPVLGQVAAPAAVLIRPDGYTAWVGDGTDTDCATR